MNIVVAENLSKTYESGAVSVPALKNVSFSISSGSIVSFIGPSGSGKTTPPELGGAWRRGIEP